MNFIKRWLYRRQWNKINRLMKKGTPSYYFNSGSSVMAGKPVTITIGKHDPFLGMKIGDPINAKIGKKKWWQFWKKKVRIYPLEISDMEEIAGGFTISMKPQKKSI